MRGLPRLRLGREILLLNFSRQLLRLLYVTRPVLTDFLFRVMGMLDVGVV